MQLAHIALRRFGEDVFNDYHRRGFPFFGIFRVRRLNLRAALRCAAQIDKSAAKRDYFYHSYVLGETCTAVGERLGQTTKQLQQTRRSIVRTVHGVAVDLSGEQVVRPHEVARSTIALFAHCRGEHGRCARCLVSLRSSNLKGVCERCVVPLTEFARKHALDGLALLEVLAKEVSDGKD